MVEKAGEKFGDLLVKSGLIDELQLQAALGHQRRWGGKLGQCLIDLGFVTESELLSFVSEQFKMPAIDLSRSRISAQAFAALPESVAKKYGVVPVFIKDAPGKKKILTLAMSDPSNLKILDELQFLTGLKVEPVLANESAIARVIEHYGNYKPEEMGARQRTDVARPSDLRKEHTRPPKPAPRPGGARQEAEDNVELILGGEEPSEGMAEILDLEEAEQEGVEIAPDEDVHVIKDEVVMVRADAPKAKSKAKVGSSTERAPTRAPIREKLDRIPEVGRAKPSHAPEPAKTGSEAQFLNVPDLGGPTPAATRVPRPQPKPAPAAPKIGIELPEDTGEKMEVAAAHEFMSWQPPEQEKPEPAKKAEAEEKMELAAAHEFMSWQPAEESKPERPQAQDLKPAPVKAEAAETGSLGTEEPQAPDQELTRLSKPESAEEDFWAEHDQAAPAGEPAAADEESLPFERELEQDPPPPPPPPTVTRQPPEPEFAPAQEPARNLQNFSAEDGDPFERPLPAPEPAPPASPAAAEVSGAEALEKQAPGEQTGEMSLEFAFQKISKLESEVKKREFQFDELLNLMMKKELGEITTELFMQELVVLKQELEKRKAKKGN